MKALAAIFLASAIAGCAGANAPLHALTDSSAVERHVLQYYQGLASLNESVGDAPITYTLDRADDLSAYRQLIAARYTSDLHDEYPAGVRPATQILLLIGKRGDHDVVQLIRLGSTSADGAFERLEGLTYVFDRNSRNVVGIRGTEY